MNESSKVALVTGGAKRLGRVIALALAQHGYRIAIHHRGSREQAESLERTISGMNGKGAAALFQASLDNPEEARGLAIAVAEHFGRIDLLVNNASMFGKTPVESVTQQDMDRFHAIHVTAPAVLSLESAKYLGAKEPGGNIINMLDIYADIPRKGYMPYSVSKSGLKSLTRQLALELAPNIRVNAVAPGAILEPNEGMEREQRETMEKRIPLNRFGDPEDIAQAVVFLAQAKYVTGQTIVVDGGRSLNI